MVMIICTGKATKRIEEFQYHTKEYIAILKAAPTPLSRFSALHYFCFTVFFLPNSMDRFSHLSFALKEANFGEALSSIMTINTIEYSSIRKLSAPRMLSLLLPLWLLSEAELLPWLL